MEMNLPHVVWYTPCSFGVFFKGKKRTFKTLQSEDLKNIAKIFGLDLLTIIKNIVVVVGRGADGSQKDEIS